ncbi:MAG: putative glycoside hydrolase [Candidatus Paceibacterota bacterium]
MALSILILFFAVYFFASGFLLVTYVNPGETNATSTVAAVVATTTTTTPTSTTTPIIVTHVKTPSAVKAVYMTSCYAGSKDLRAGIVSLIDTTELNSIIIDVKDYTGMISFLPENPAWADYLSTRCHARDMKAFIKVLHDKGIYVIARITVFQDPFYAKKNPAAAVKLASDKSVLWKDRKGINYIDPGSRQAWEHTAQLSEESYAIGFDEINFDYIRFPSDGNMKDIYYPYSEGKLKVEVMKSFFEFLHNRFASTSIVTSADLFGMVTTNTDDLGIGQNLEYALANFDYVAPMVYPSHFPATWNGLKNPAQNPYEVIKISMTRAAERARVATTTPLKLRPWLQDFNMGATYTADMVRAQIQATYDSGLTSWMMWDPSNTYTAGAFLPANSSLVGSGNQ